MKQSNRILLIGVIAMSVLVLGAIIYDLATDTAPAPIFYSINLSRDEVIETFEPLGFTFTQVEDIYDQEQWQGVAPDGHFVIQMVGPDDQLVGLASATHVWEGISKSTLNQLRGYQYALLSILFPTWGGRESWLSDTVLDLGDNGSRASERDGINLRVAVRSSDMTYGVCAGAWPLIHPMYDDEDNNWRFSK
ncbi:MAG: hypothetical protein JW750_04665 [Anaerolineaceae bacterium]|nr:hypothetical protein [Anaerolineaceae bacterium]